jgi:hypothetical protein
MMHGSLLNFRSLFILDTLYIRLINQIRTKSVRDSGSVVEAISEPL